MVDFMEQVLDIKAAEMSSEERNLLQNSYKNLIQKQRETWRLVNILTDDDQYGKYKSSLKTYKKALQDRMHDQGVRIVKRIKEVVLGNNKIDNEPRAFFLKLSGDFMRYTAEVVESDVLLFQIKADAKQFYEEANKIPLKPCDLTKLSLSLNYSVFLFEVLEKEELAI